MQEKYRRKVRWWLATGAFLVIAMVVVGGITRLTHSGLSMTDWKPLSGIVPPITDLEWQAEFENYKKFPEYQKIHYNFELEDFKSIFWWEFIHRFLGRIIGIVFIVPYVFFLFKKVFNRKWNIRLIVLFALGGFQGFLGWFMVKSGLVDNPAVSHYRLAIHLINALFLFGYIAWLYLDLSTRKTVEKAGSSTKKWAVGLMVLLVLQIIYGAFVAGLKAGLIINTWPLMGDSLVSPIVGNSFDKWGLLSLVEEPVTVQFIHRMIPFFIAAIIIVLIKKVDAFPKLKSRIRVVGIVWLLQFSLGVVTLLTRVPVTMGVLHQLGGVIFLAVTIYFMHPMFSKLTPSVSEN